MPYDDVPAFVTSLRSNPKVVAAAFEYLILTAARSGEVLGATWREVDLEKALWVVPATRMNAAA
jgi:integrase